jgi:F-type H+-transporting ATPase subunit epsilon
MQFKLVTPDGVTYEDDAVTEVILPSSTGQIGVLPKHIPLVSILMPGEIVVKKTDHEVSLAVSGGVIEVRPNDEVYVMADTAERAEHIDLSRAEAAKKRAEELLKRENAAADVDFARLQAVIERETARMRVGKKYKKLPLN